MAGDEDAGALLVEALEAQGLEGGVAQVVVSQGDQRLRRGREGKTAHHWQGVRKEASDDEATRGPLSSFGT